jgi:hypothetical protein
MDFQLEILLLFYMPNHFKRPPSNIAHNIGLKQPVGLEWNEVTSRVFSERKNLGISRAEGNSV